MKLFSFLDNMADGGKRFCLNPSPEEGIWTWFYQAAEDLEWHAIGLTHVEYPTGKLYCLSYKYFLENVRHSDQITHNF